MGGGGGTDFGKQRKVLYGIGGADAELGAVWLLRFEVTGNCAAILSKNGRVSVLP